MRALGGLALSLLVVLALARPAPADEIVTKSGSKYSGKIVEETNDHVKIRTKFGGVMTVKRADIASITREVSKSDEFRARLAKIDPGDSAALWELARWCRVEGLGAEFQEAAKKVIAVEPDHAEARKALGHVRYQDRWVTRSEAEKLERAALEAEMKSKGMVQYKGRWVSEADVEKLKQGLIQHEGRWITKEEKGYLDKGYVRYEGEWVTREEKDNREKGLYRVGRKWVSEKDADQFHSEWDTAWQIQGTGFTVRSNAPIQYINSQKEFIAGMMKAMHAFCLGRTPGQDLPIHIYKTIGEYNAVQPTVQTEGFPSPMYYAYHSASIGGVFKYTEPAFVATFKFDTKFYQYLFLGHGIGEAYLWNVLGRDSAIEPWFLLGPGHYYGFSQLGAVIFNVSHVQQQLGENYIPLSTLLGTHELSQSEDWNTRFYYQSAALIYLLLKDPRYAGTFRKARAEIFKLADARKARQEVLGTGEITETLKKHFDPKELETSLKALLASRQPIPDEVKEE